MEKNTIIIYFYPYLGTEIEQKDCNNKKAVYKMIDAFQDESTIIEKQNLCFSFGYRRKGKEALLNLYNQKRTNPNKLKKLRIKEKEL